MSAPEGAVRVRDCPTGLHNGEGDWVLLAPHLSLEGGFQAEDDLVSVTADFPIPEGSSPEAGKVIEQRRNTALQRRWAITFIRHGAVDWNLHDEAGDDIPFDVETLLSDYEIARPVADAAADKYSDTVLAPFLMRLAARSPTGRTGATTSRARGQTRKSSGQSSPANTAASQQSMR